MKHLFQKWGALPFGLAIAFLGLVLDQAWKLSFLFGLGWVETLGPGPNGLRYEILPFFDIVTVLASSNP